MSKNKIKAKTLSLFKYKRGLIITLKIAAGLVGFLVLLVIVGAFIPYALSSKECQTFTTIDTRHQASTPDTSITGYSRPEESTYLTFPEWYIVYSAEEYAHFIKFNPPSRFPYFSSIGQYWCGYKQVSRAVKKSGLPSNFGDQLMLGVIGTSYSLEYEFKALYENTIGNVTEVLSFNQKTDEDVYAQKVAQEYADFLYEIPWYQFPFGSKLKGLWTHTRFLVHILSENQSVKLS